MKLDLHILTEEAEEALVQHGLVGPASRDFVAWMESKRLPQDLIRALTRMSPKKEIWAGAGALFAEEGIIKVNEDFPQALRAELFYVGCAGNGDPIAIDVGPGAGATGYIDHEMMWDVEDVREVFISVASSIGAFLYHINFNDEDVIPDDYYDAKERLEKG